MAQWIGREWCFTINAPKFTLIDDEAEEFLLPFYLKCSTLNCKYIAVKGEIGESGNYHLQGFVIFNEANKFKQIKELFGCGSMHLEKRSSKSTNLQAANYVKKEATTWGVFPLIERGSLGDPVHCPRYPRGAWEALHFPTCVECLAHRKRELDSFAEYSEKLV